MCLDDNGLLRVLLSFVRENNHIHKFLARVESARFRALLFECHRKIKNTLKFLSTPGVQNIETLKHLLHLNTLQIFGNDISQKTHYKVLGN